VPKRFEYSAAAAAEGAVDIAPNASPEELVLVALVRCSLTSLAHFAEREGIRSTGRGAADGVVAKREQDGRFAFVEVDCGLDVELEPKPESEALGELLDSAEWGCFVGASLAVRPRYEWRVNGELVARSR
jgi:organic hydroperoxide reductase OsmC/OhrA